MAAPLTDLPKASGALKFNWSLECETAFNLIKSTLTSAPVLRHFDPALRIAVHVDGSQNAVGAVLLQWQPGESHPGPVAFMSQKLVGAQYRYDARNVEALAFAAGLWAVSVAPNETALQAVRWALCPILPAQCKQPIMSCVAHSGNVEFWRADFSNKDEMHLPMEAHHAVWIAPTALPCRHQWHLPPFECLPHFGVWCAWGNGGVFPSDWGSVL